MPVEQVPLVFFGTQEMPSQYEPVPQEIPAQVVTQPLPSAAHRLLVHEPAFTAGQVPEPSQYEAGVKFPPVQLGCEQRVDPPGNVQALPFPSHCPLQGAVPGQAVR